MTRIICADLSKPMHAKAIVDLMSQYALDPMGGGKDLPQEVKSNLAACLGARNDVTVLLAYMNAEAIGLLTAFEGFSTFKCKPLLNIHDIIVKSGFRGRGIAGQLLEAIEPIARAKDCCKLTLEVLSGNEPAKVAYQRQGFRAYQLDPQMGEAWFWEKPL